MKPPKISVGLPVYNGERYIRRALDSLLKQDFEDFEIVISDNASTDGTQQICEAYCASDKRIRYSRNQMNIGASPNYNRVFELSRGEFFKWCAHDDVCHPAFIRRCLDLMSSAPPSVALVYSQCDLIDEEGKILERAPDRMVVKSKRPFRRLGHVLRNVGYAHSLWGLIRSDSLRQTRLMAEGALSDYVLLAELSMFGKFWEVPEVLFQLRMHQNNAWAVCSREQGTIAWEDNAKANRKSRQKLRAWTDARFANKRVWLPFKEDLYWRYLKGVHHAQLPFFDKLLCYITVPTVCYWRRFKNLGAIWKRRLRKGLSPRPGADKRVTGIPEIRN